MDDFQKARIRGIKVYGSICYNQKGEVIYRHDEDCTRILTFEEIRKKVFERILSSRFSSIERVAPNKANCIIRVYSAQDCAFEGSTSISFYGSHCYTKRFSSWITAINYPIDFSKHIIRNWVCQDEYHDIECDFVDYFVKIY